MHLDNLKIINFKNYISEEFSFSSEVNCLSGNNGSGKTNVLDAIYYLCFCKSYFSQIDKNNIRHGESYFSLKGAFEQEEETDTIICAVQEGKKKSIKRNDKVYDKLAEHIGRYPAVIITPNDIDLIKEGSVVRRKFIDGIISQYNKEYLYQLIDYNRVLTQRNNLLKHFKQEHRFDPEVLEIWDLQLVELGKKIYESREDFIEKFNPIFIKLYNHLSGENEQVNLTYKTHLHSSTSFEDQLKNSQSSDRMMQRTTVGIHKDDLIFKIHEHPLKITGSQGQQKSFLIALKLAQFEFIKEATGKKPILLLDDVFDKIDDERVGFLMELVSQRSFGQIFISDTHENRVSKLFEEMDISVREFFINKGKTETVSS